jgi:hypothetical protein
MVGVSVSVVVGVGVWVSTGCGVAVAVGSNVWVCVGVGVTLVRIGAVVGLGRDVKVICGATAGAHPIIMVTSNRLSAVFRNDFMGLSLAIAERNFSYNDNEYLMKSILFFVII